jgi:hypothetical protein
MGFDDCFRRDAARWQVSGVISGECCLTGSGSGVPIGGLLGEMRERLTGVLIDELPAGEARVRVRAVVRIAATAIAVLLDRALRRAPAVRIPPAGLERCDWVEEPRPKRGARELA